MRPLAERTSSLPCGCVVGAPCDCDGPFECEYCGDLAEQLYLVVDADPSVGYRDEKEVCEGCLKIFNGQEQREREAEANFEYYKGADEP